MRQAYRKIGKFYSKFLIFLKFRTLEGTVVATICISIKNWQWLFVRARTICRGPIQQYYGAPTNAPPDRGDRTS